MAEKKSLVIILKIYNGLKIIKSYFMTTIIILFYNYNHFIFEINFLNSHLKF